MTEQNCKQTRKQKRHWNATRTHHLHCAKPKDCYTAFHLASMHTLPLTLAICAGLAAAQVGIVALCIRNWDAGTYGALSFAALVSTAQLGWIFRIALALVGAICLYGGFGKGSPAYLVHRLTLRPADVGFGWACNTAACLLMLWGVETLVLGGCYLLFSAQASALTWGSHTFLTESYRDGFLHAMLPMGDGILWVRNLMALAAVSLASGTGTLRLWRGKQPALGVCALVMLVYFFESIGTDSILDIVLIVCFGWNVLDASLQLLGTGRAVWEET